MFKVRKVREFISAVNQIYKRRNGKKYRDIMVFINLLLCARACIVLRNLLLNLENRFDYDNKCVRSIQG